MPQVLSRFAGLIRRLRLRQRGSRRRVSRRELLEPQLGIVRLESRRVLAAPEVTGAGNDPLDYTEGDMDVAISPMISVMDSDSPNLEGATIQITGGYQAGQDVLSVNLPMGSGITNDGFNAMTGTLTLSGMASPEDYQAALRAVTYENTSEDPTDTDDPDGMDRVVTFTVDDGAETGTATRAIDLVAVNDPPTLTGLAASVSFSEDAVNATPAIIDSNVTFSDPDLAAGSLTVSYSVGGSAQDQLSIRNEGTDPGEIGVSGGNVTYGGTIIGTIDGTNNGMNGAALLVNFNGNVTAPAVEALIENVTYANSSDAPTAMRTVQFTVNDGSGAMNGTVSAQTVVTVNASNDPPVLTVAPISVIENTANGTAVHTVQVMDPDGNPLDRQFSITASSVVGAFSIDAATGVIRVNDATKLNFEATPSITVTVQVSDNGNTGAGGPRTDTEVFTIMLLDEFEVGGGGEATLRLEDVGGLDYLVARDENNMVINSALFATVTSVRVDLSLVDPNDTLIIDFSNGNPIPLANGITFVGGSTGTDIDNLNLVAGPGAFTTITHIAEPGDNGTIVIDGLYTIRYLDVEFVNDGLVAQNREFSFTGGNETITLSDDPVVNNGMSRIDSSVAAQITFAGPVDGDLGDMTPATLTIRTTDGSGADTVNVQGLDAMFAANLAILTDSDPGQTDAVRFQTNNTNLGGGDLQVTAFNVVFDRQVMTTGSVDVDADNDISLNAMGGIQATGSGGVSLTADANGDMNGSGGRIIMAAGAGVNAGSGSLELRADGNIQVVALATTGEARITSTSGAILDVADSVADVTAGSLALRAATGIGSGNALETSVSTLAAMNTTSGNIRIDNSVGGLLTIGTVDTLPGITNANPMFPGSIVITNASPITIIADVVDLAGGDITIAAEGLLLADDLTINANITASGGAGSIHLFAGDTVAIGMSSVVISAASTGAVNVWAGTDYNSGVPLDGNAAGGITMADGSSIQSEAGNIALRAPGDIGLSVIDADSDDMGGAGIVVITADFDGVGATLADGSGAITDTLTGDSFNIRAAEVALRAASGIGADGNDLNTASSTGGSLELAAVTDSGDIHVSNVGALEIGTVDTLVGVTIVDSADDNSGGDNITLVAASPLTVNAAVVNNDGGLIGLTAGGTMATDDLALNAAVTAAGGNGSITLNAASDILQNAGGNISAAGSGALDFNAGTGTADGVITQANTTTTVTSTGLITLDADGDITIANLQTGNATAAAISIVTTAGGVIDGGDMNTDIIASSGTVVITAATGIGSAPGVGGAANAAIETTIGTLDATVNGTGNIAIAESDGLVLSDVDTADGSITITAAGAITATQVDSGGGAGDSVSLTTTTGNITVGSIVSADTVLLDTNSGSIVDSADDDVVDITAAGLITLNATADINGPDADGRLDLAANSSVNASSETAGEIALRGLGAITLVDVDTVDGAINVLAAGAITATQVDSGGGAGDSVSLTTTTGNITVGSISSANTVLLDTNSGSIVDSADDAIVDITAAGLITLNATANINGPGVDGRLDLAAGSSVDASSETAGEITLRGLGAITLVDVDTVNGAINVLAAGAITATQVDSGGGAGDSVSLTTTTGNITVGSISSAATVLLDTDSGSIVDSADDVIVDITAAGLITLNATADINGPGMDGRLDLAANSSVNASSETVGEIALRGLGAITLVDVDTVDGAINVVAAGAITATQVDSGGGAGDNVSLTTTTGNITVGSISSANTVLLDTDSGSIVDSADDAIVDITAAGLITLNATADINGPDADGRLDLAAGSSVDASSETAGEIALRGLGAITLTDVDTVDGAINVVAAGAITATQVDSGGGAGDSVSLTTTTGNITVGSISSAATVLLDTDSGSIVDSADDAIVDITAAGLITLNATANINGPGVDGRLDLAANSSVNASSETAGEIALRGLGSITLMDVDTVNGAINVVAAGAIMATQVDSGGGAGDSVSLTTTTGNITVGSISSAATVLLDTDSGSIVDSADDAIVDITAAGLITLNATANINGPGVDGRLDLAAGSSVDASSETAGEIALRGLGAITLTDVDTVNGAINVVAAGAITATQVDSGGGAGDSVSLTTTTGNITVGSIGSADTVLLDTNSGSIVDSADDAIADITAAGLITLNATANINGPGVDGRLDLAAGSSVDASSETAGEIALRGLGSITLVDVDTVNGAINVLAAGAITATQVDSGGGAGDSVSLTTTTGNITVGSISSVATVLLDTDSGSIVDSADDAVVDITAAGLITLNATANINGPGVDGRLDLAAGSSVDASSETAGEIALRGLGAITLVDADTADGSISVEAVGRIVATWVDSSATNSEANDIHLNSLMDDIVLTRVDAGMLGDVTVIAVDGSILSSATLVASIGVMDSTVTVEDAGGFPSAGPFNILIGDEVLTVTGVTGNDLSVMRGQDGTTAAAHDSGLPVRLVTRLDGMLDDTITTVTVDDASAFPSSGNFFVRVGGERMEVTSVVGDVFTVMRGAGSSFPTAHNDGAFLTLEIAEITADEATLMAQDIGVITNFAAGTGTPIRIELSGELQQAFVDDVVGVGVIHLQFIGDFSAAMDSITVDATGNGQALISATGNIDVSDPAVSDAFVLMGNDSVGLDAGGTLTLDDTGLDVNDGDMFLGGHTIVDDSGMPTTLLGVLQAENLVIRITNPLAAPTTLTTSVGTLTVVTVPNLIVNDLSGLVTVTSVDASGDFTLRAADALMPAGTGRIVDSSTADQPVIRVAGTLTLEARLGIGDDSDPMNVNVLDVRASHIVATVVEDGSMHLNNWLDASITTDVLLNLATMQDGQIVFEQDLASGETLAPGAGHLAIDSIVATSNGVIEVPGDLTDGYVTLINRIGKILDDDAVGTVDVTAVRLVMHASGDIGRGVNGAIETDVSELAARGGEAGVAIANLDGNMGTIVTLVVGTAPDGTMINGIETPLGRLPARVGDPNPTLTLQNGDTAAPMLGEVNFDMDAGDENGVNYTVTVDWCNEPDADCNLEALGTGIEMQVRPMMGEPMINGRTLQHFEQAYVGSPIKSEPNTYSIKVSIDAAGDISLTDDGVDLTETVFTDKGPIDTFASVNNVEPTPTPPTTVATPAFSVAVESVESSTTLSTQPLDQASGGSGAGVEEEIRYVLRIVLPDGGEAKGDLDIELPSDVLSNLEETLRGLPDDRYRLYLIRKDKTEELVREFEIRDGRIREQEIQLDSQLAPSQPAGGATNPAVVPAAGNPAPVGPAGNGPAGETGQDGGPPVGTPADPSQTPPAQLDLNQPQSARDVPLRGAAVTLGAAWLAQAGSRAWEEQVDAALSRPRPRSLGPAARLWNRIARRS